MSKQMRGQDNTFAAIATPVGEGGIGVVQVVGPRALAVVSEMFRGKHIDDLTTGKSGKLYYGHILDAGKVVDEVIVAVFRKGESLLADELVEINCHGGIACVNQVIHLLGGRGIRIGNWRKLLANGVTHGGLDRIQQEALLALVQAKTELAVQVFLTQFEGALAKAVGMVKARIDKGCHNQDIGEVRTAAGMLDELSASARIGLAFSEVRTVVVCGRTNVGKSSLVNALLKARRLIVDGAPGTTRDAVEVLAAVEGLPVEVVDTAGLRQTRDEIEIVGLQKAHESIRKADFLLAVFDHGSALTLEEEHFACQLAGRESLVVVNKSDMACRIDLGLLERLSRRRPVLVSALRGWGISRLGAHIRAGLVGSDSLDVRRPVVFTRRQQEIVTESKGELRQAIKCLEDDSKAQASVYITRAVIRLGQMLSVE